jgi:phage terminase large subunit-like protein
MRNSPTSWRGRPANTSAGARPRTRRPTPIRPTTLKGETLLPLLRADPAAFLRFCLTDPRGEPLDVAQVHEDLQDFLTAHRHALVELPRDHGKSTQVCGRVIWELGRNPGLRVKVVCATAAIARDRSRFLREQVAGNPRVRRVFPHLAPAGPWAAEAFTVRRPAEVIGPSVSAVGVAGGATGTRADLLICDDVVDVKSLHSKADRERASAAFHDNLMNLLEPDGRCWCLFTPWHRDDLNARLARNPRYAHFRRAVGPDLEPVWPGRWPAEQLAARRAEIGPTAFARGYHLVPAAAEDLLIRPEWIQLWTERPPAFDTVVLAVDPAVTPSPSADASAIVVLGRTGNAVYCLEAAAHRVGVPDLMTLIDEADRRWQPTAIAFEENAAFRGIKDLFARHARFGPKLVGVRQTRSKAARFAAFAVRVESGCFRLMGRATGLSPGQQALWSEMTSYPLGDTNDLLDAAAMGTEQALAYREPDVWVF